MDSLRASEGRLGALAIENSRLYESARRAGDDLREANQHMVSATIRAQESTEKAEAALRRAEESERELRAVAEFREMFVGIVGHDLRTPLATIRLSAEMLRPQNQMDELGHQAVDRIIRSSERMNRMILQLLDFTRGRLGGGFPLEPKPTDLREVCQRVVEEFASPVRLEIEDDVTGLWDPDRLTEALSNLVGNAVEHARAGTAVVVRARSEGAEAAVEVVNLGDPIPGEVLPFIFEPFHRGTSARSPAGNLGLGLYIAKQIVLAGGGTLDVRSVEGTTTFVMRLPRRRPSTSPSLPQGEGRA